MAESCRSLIADLCTAIAEILVNFGNFRNFGKLLWFQFPRGTETNVHLLTPEKSVLIKLVIVKERSVRFTLIKLAILSLKNDSLCQFYVNIN